jgi:hypothetical protein
MMKLLNFETDARFISAVGALALGGVALVVKACQEDAKHNDEANRQFGVRLAEHHKTTGVNKKPLALA